VGFSASVVLTAFSEVLVTTVAAKITHLRDTLARLGEYSEPSCGSRTPHEDAGQLPALLVEQGQLPCGTHVQALRRCEKGNPAVRRGRKAHGPALLKHRESR
jgi:hypothetical protein